MMIAVTLGFSGCKSNNGDKAQLTANEWQLKEMTTTKGKTALPQRVPTLMLTDTNTMYGFSGCNRFFGKYSTQGNTIKLEPGGSTMMACPDLQFEGEYMRTLAVMTSYSIENKELKLTDKDRKQTLVFVPKTEEEIIGVMHLSADLMDLFGFSYRIFISTRPDDSIGSDEAWELATSALIKAV